MDQSEVQARKRSKLPEEVPNAENITYVAVDFTDQSISDQLLDAGFDQNKSTVFTLEASRSTSLKKLSDQLSKMWPLAQKANSIVFVSYANDLLNKDPEACFGRVTQALRKEQDYLHIGQRKQANLGYHSTELKK